MTRELLEVVALDIQEERRRYNKMFLDAVKGEINIFNLEDLMRLLGTLEAAYNHALAAYDSLDIYCLLKHMAYAIILAGEVDGEVASLYQIMATITDEKVQPCQSCLQDREKEDNGPTKQTKGTPKAKKGKR